MVNPTDEALIMQVVTCYFPRWDSGQEMDEEDSAGAKKGEKNTGARTMKIYYNYMAKFKDARKSRFVGLWDKKLREEAINQHLSVLVERIGLKRRRQRNLIRSRKGVLRLMVLGWIFGDDERTMVTEV